VRHRIAAAIVTCALVAVPAAAQGASYPNRGQLDAVRDYLKQRGGVVGVGVIDDHGRVRGVRDRRRFVSASVVKAMLLVSYLRKVAHQDRGLSRDERSQLGPMITVSSNRAADWAYARVGASSLRRLARRADMDQFSIICCRWTLAYFSARDQAKFFWRLEELTPRRFRDYATKLLRSVVPRQSWGIPHVGRPRGFSVFFKGGWRPTSIGRLVHQASFVRYGRTEFSLVVLTDGNPSKSYGIATIEGVARRILRVRPRPAQRRTLNTRRACTVAPSLGSNLADSWSAATWSGRRVRRALLPSFRLSCRLETDASASPLASRIARPDGYGSRASVMRRAPSSAAGTLSSSARPRTSALSFLPLFARAASRSSWSR
jgi:beta-lactamase class A